MNRLLAGLALLAVGAVLATLYYGSAGAVWAPEAFRPTARKVSDSELKHLPASTLFRRLANRNSPDIVADSRTLAKAHPYGGITFYARPSAAPLAGLCELGTYAFYPHGGELRSRGVFGFVEAFVVRRDFRLGLKDDGTAEKKACEGYRDFSKIVRTFDAEDALAAPRVVRLLAEAKQAALDGQPLNITCQIDLESGSSRSCDGRKELAALDLWDLRQIDSDRRPDPPPFSYHDLAWVNHALLPGERFYERVWMIFIDSREPEGRGPAKAVKIEMKLAYAA